MRVMHAEDGGTPWMLGRGQAKMCSHAQRLHASQVTQQAVSRLSEAWEAGGAVDEYTLDQLVVFMALAKGELRLGWNPRWRLGHVL